MIFSNCKILSPEGELISRCDERKIKWYLDRGIAEQVSKDPPTIKLKFAPKGNKGANQPHILFGKPNICVICGTDEELTKHHIVPYSYMRYFNAILRSDCIKDILPLCNNCHESYEQIAYNRQYQLLLDRGFDYVAYWKPLTKAIVNASALLKYNNLPLKRKKALINLLTKYLGRTPSNEDIVDLGSTKLSSREEYRTPAKTLLEMDKDHAKIAEDWRQYFIDTAEPKYMPHWWTVERDLSDSWVPAYWAD